MDTTMTTMQVNRKRERNKKWKKKNIIRVSCWNITSWILRDQEIITELSEKNIDICCISETKKKGKGIKKIGDFILIYSGRDKTQRAKAGVGILIHEKFEKLIDKIDYVNERILILTLNTSNKYTHIISVYAPDISKHREERKQFYEDLQNQVNKITTPDDNIIIMGDLNARVGNDIIPGIKHRFNEDAHNDNGDLLVDFCCQNNLRINNTFFDHKWQHKYTWSNTRGQQSVIDYIITSRHIQPEQITDVRTLNSANIGSDHDLLLGKIKLQHHTQRKHISTLVEKFNIRSLENGSTKSLYENRLNKKIELNAITDEDNVNDAWGKIKQNILKAAEEAIGKRKVNGDPARNRKPWFTSEVKEVAEKKKKAYTQYRRTGNQEDKEKYVRERNSANIKIRKLKEEYWEQFTKDMEHDLYGSQKKIWKMLRNSKREINDTIKTTKINKSQWQEYFENLYKNDNPSDADIETVETTKTQITKKDVERNIKKLKNGKAPGVDDISNELLKYGNNRLVEELTKLYQKTMKEKKIPIEWKTSITIPLHKKGEKSKPENYRGITLLSSALKLMTKIITEILDPFLKISEEQQGFRQNRSTTDAIFIVRQVAEKAIEFAKPAYLCFVDMTKAFDRVKLQDIQNILQEKEVPVDLQMVIKELNTNTKTKIQVGNDLTEEIPTSTGIRQGDSLSPLLFSAIMDKIIESVRKLPGYYLGEHNINIICFADDAVLIAETEDDLQRMLHNFTINARKYNMEISIEKTKTMTISKEPLRCKLEIEGKIIQQVMSFKYLGATITSDKHLNAEVREQVMKGARISGYLKDIIWKNKYMTIDSKMKIYKTTVRPIMTFGAETRADTAKSKQIMRTAEMNTLRTIVGKTRMDRVRNQEVRQQCNINDIVKFTKKRRKEWNEHINRAGDDRLIKISRDHNPSTKRHIGRPPKRWKESWVTTSEDTP